MLRLRQLQLRVRAGGRLFGADLTFQSGLNVLRASNTSGKSTCLQAIIYALGLEGMLSPKREAPMAHVMTDSLEYGSISLPVEDSWVTLEFENSRGAVMQVQRAVVSGRSDTNLIRTTVIDPSIKSQNANDYFVRRAGAAAREAGFHFQLARFLGWTLPSVARNDGSEGLLYLECLFPYFYVEQKHGWSGLQARIPTYLQIREVGKRSAEFVLGLDIYERILTRQRLLAASQIMTSDWQQTVAALTAQLRAKSVLIEGLPAKPVASMAILGFVPIWPTTRIGYL